jgi:SsrA-binding protein
MAEKDASALCQNRKAGFEYEIIETIEAGIALFGTEVKSLRLGGGNLQGSHAIFSSSGAVLYNLSIAPYKFSPPDKIHDPLRNKHLLLHKHQINKFAGKVKEKGMTIIPLKMYINKRGKVKVLLGLCKGKQQHDKREAIKQRDLSREMRRKETRYD